MVPEVYGTGEVSMNTSAKIDFPVSDIRRFRARSGPKSVIAFRSAGRQLPGRGVYEITSLCRPVIVS